MIFFPNCKINLGLSVTGKRKDGYHNLETCFYPVPLHDVLEILALQPPVDISLKEPGIELSTTGFVVPGDANDNLCTRAYRMLKQDFPQLPQIAMHLHKAIPMGAGLGGGSADGAYALQLLNETFELNLTSNQLLSYALQLGSDCPFFILNKPCLATGRGEVMEPLPLDLSGNTLVLVSCGIHINTGWAFSQLNRQQTAGNTEPSGKLKQILQLPVENWKELLINDFELPVFEQHPAIRNIKDQLYLAGALYASMSGSGSTVYGIFPETAKPAFNFPAKYEVRSVLLV